MFDRLRRQCGIVRRDLKTRGPESGATAVEYALMTGLIAAVIVVAVAALGSQVVVLFRLGADAFP